MYKIKMLCYDSNPKVKPYLDEPDGYNIFENDVVAYDKALDLANREAEDLNIGCDKNVSFGIVEDELCNKITVNCYYNEDGDNTGNTETVTEYHIIEA